MNLLMLGFNGKTGDRPPAYTFIEPVGIRQTGDRGRSPLRSARSPVPSGFGIHKISS
ncbi:MAG: hypothetical protein FWG68_03500 [Defluviitaleaceae bacterium]|nr:hypothetical protein [Defluviitaleaceae bacterium]